jgi:uncharacterized protein YqhQ
MMKDEKETEVYLMSENNNSPSFKTKIGGQAVIEGVMMRGPKKMAMACRLPDGTIDIEEWDTAGKNGAPWYRKVPFIRGIFNFVISMKDGYMCLSKSADKQMTDDDEAEESRFEKWLSEKLGDKLMPIVSGISIVIGLALAIFLFMMVPSWILKLIGNFVEFIFSTESIVIV